MNEYPYLELGGFYFGFALQRAETAGCLPPVEEPSPDAEVPCEGKP